jgi:hypothetical protein
VPPGAAGTGFPAFTWTKGQEIARLIVRRDRDRDKQAAAGQDEPFPAAAVTWTRRPAAGQDEPFPAATAFPAPAATASLGPAAPLPLRLLRGLPALCHFWGTMVRIFFREAGIRRKRRGARGDGGTRGAGAA